MKKRAKDSADIFLKNIFRGKDAQAPKKLERHTLSHVEVMLNFSETGLHSELE